MKKAEKQLLDIGYTKNVVNNVFYKTIKAKKIKKNANRWLDETTIFVDIEKKRIYVDGKFIPEELYEEFNLLKNIEL